jgi:hypothetical protein
MEQYGNSSIQSTVQLAVAFGRLHDLASQVVAVPRDREDTIPVSREAVYRLQAMEQNRDSIQSVVQLAIAFGRLHDLVSQVVAVPRDRDDTIPVSREAVYRLQDHLEQMEQHYGLPRHADQEWQARQRGQERQSQAGSRDVH